MYNDFIVLGNVVKYGILYPYFTDIGHVSRPGNSFYILVILNVFQSSISLSHHSQTIQLNMWNILYWNISTHITCMMIFAVSKIKVSEAIFHFIKKKTGYNMKSSINSVKFIS